MKKALITGATGMDASYLAELLLSKGYGVWGMVRQSSNINTWRIEHLLSDSAHSLQLVHGDMTDLASLIHILRKVAPDEIYNLAAQSHVKVSFDVPIATSLVDAIGALNLFEAVRIVGLSSRIYQASSSEMYGKVRESPQVESTPFHPRSPYACSKAHAFYSAVNYREAYRMHISNGVLFNHTSPRRGDTFVEKKIVRAVARIHRREQDVLLLGNLLAKRDFGWAPEYVEAMWRILQQPDGDDFVIATGETHSIMEIVEVAFAHVGMDHRDYVKVDERLLRPSEVDLLCGHPGKAVDVLGWSPKTKFNDIITTMLEYEIEYPNTKVARDITWRA